MKQLLPKARAQRAEWRRWRRKVNELSVARRRLQIDFLINDVDIFAQFIPARRLILTCA